MTIDNITMAFRVSDKEIPYWRTKNKGVVEKHGKEHGGRGEMGGAPPPPPEFFLYKVVNNKI
jgi:hypothetical protein